MHETRFDSGNLDRVNGYVPQSFGITWLVFLGADLLVFVGLMKFLNPLKNRGIEKYTKCHKSLAGPIDTISLISSSISAKIKGSSIQ